MMLSRFLRIRKSTLRVLIAVFTVQLFSFSLPSYAKDGDGERQDVLQRTMQYSRGVDLVEVGRQVRSDWIRPRGGITHSSSIEGMSKNCNGYTVSECGIPCCGKRECELVCTENNTIAHGDEMCLSSVQTSECGMSCCGAEDCANVCLNYRVTGDCGGYTKTPDGRECCGYDDCRTKACGSYTSVTTVSGQKEACCGQDNCEKVRCEYQLKTTGQWGGTQGLACCGREQCYEKECGGYTSTDSRVHPEKQDIPCCGAENCNLTACDGYISVQTPKGLVSCCGYEDCHSKECEDYTIVRLDNGTHIACCGARECQYLKDCYTPGKIATCVMRWEDAKEGVTADLVNTDYGEAILYMGVVGDNYWGGWCTIYEHWTRVRVMQPQAIRKVVIEFAKWDDWLQIYIGKSDIRYMDLVYEGPYPGQFPPETDGACELSTSWEKAPNVDVTRYFRNVPANSIVSFKTRVSVAGNGEGYARLRIYYDTLGTL